MQTAGHILPMNYYQDFQPTTETFEDRIGPPDAFDAGLGRIALAFSFMEDTFRNTIILLSKSERRTAHTLVAQLSFKQKAEVLESLVAHELESSTEVSLGAQIGEMFQLCRRSEELRNTYLHSSYAGAVRAKFSARNKRGLRVAKEFVSPALLLDVADFIVSAAMEIEGIPILLGYADTVTGNEDVMAYEKEGREVARFRFGKVD